MLCVKLRIGRSLEVQTTAQPNDGGTDISSINQDVVVCNVICSTGSPIKCRFRKSSVLNAGVEKELTLIGRFGSQVFG